MADIIHPPQADGALEAQLAAREAASRQDAVALSALRSEAAARALGLDLPPGPRPAASPGPSPVSAPQPAPAPTAEEAHPRLPPGVVVPTAGPARVTTGVLAAAAAQRPRPERPVMELRPTVLATDIDRIGDQLVVLKDRLELRDRHGGLRRTLALADIDDVRIQRRLTSAVLVVSTRTATDLVIKGLRPDAAESAQETILGLRPEPATVVEQIDERSLMRAIVELHRAGVLDDLELAAKTAQVTQMTGRSGRS